ncbi:hypothetical protein MN116_008850 [Schistosoma mekongi]|uniref:Rho-GAP domain-containing protein n=1 Tax=Schistosoma mekongi TaxID=38744 RepID=A0AAE2D1C9_SCHME|nr:hypothetical protein MN116_008850 [Schistosoma mekongi]
MLRWSKDKKEEQPANWPKYAEHLEQCVEDVRRVSSDAHRGLVQNILVSKKNKKYPEYTLSTVLKESVDKSSADDRLFVCVTREASKALSVLFSYHRDHENKVERQIVDPLNRLAEETCVNITKGRRNLQKCLTDVRNARGQLQKTMQCIQTNTTSVYPGSCNPSVTIDAVNRIGQAQHQLEEKESELESSEGLFRKSGSQKRTDLLVKALNIMQIDEHLLRKCDCAVVAGALKQYLLSLPEPLITYEFADQWATASKKLNSPTSNMQLVQSCLEQMPKEFRLNLGYLICFLHKLSNQSNVNKMTSDNLSIVIAPNIYRLSTSHMNNVTGNIVTGASLMRSVDDVLKSLDFLQNNSPGIHLVDILIQNAEQLFGQEQASFRQTHIQSHFGTKISYHPLVDSLSSSKLSNSGIGFFYGSDNSPTASNEQASQTINQSATLKKPIGTDHRDSNCHTTQSAVTSRISISSTTPILQRKKTAAPKPPIPLYLTSSSTTHVNNSNSLKTEDSSVNDTESKNEGSDNTNSCNSNNTTLEGTMQPLPTRHHESLPQLTNGSLNFPASSTESTTSTNHKLSLPTHLTTTVSPSSNDWKLGKDAPPKRPPPPDVNL